MGFKMDLTGLGSTQGVCDRVLSWQEIGWCIDNNRVELMGRKSAEWDAYMKSIAKIKEEWVTVGDYILCERFGWVRSANAESKKQMAVVTPKPSPPSHPSILTRGSVTPPGSGSSVNWVLTINDFKYNFAPGIDHHLLWSQGDRLLTREEVQIIIEDKLPDREFLVFVNPPRLQSVKNVAHTHVISRRRRTALVSTQAPHTSGWLTLLWASVLVSFWLSSRTRA